MSVSTLAMLCCYALSLFLVDRRHCFLQITNRVVDLSDLPDCLGNLAGHSAAAIRKNLACVVECDRFGFAVFWKTLRNLNTFHLGNRNCVIIVSAGDLSHHRDLAKFVKQVATRDERHLVLQLSEHASDVDAERMALTKAWDPSNPKLVDRALGRHLAA